MVVKEPDYPYLGELPRPSRDEMLMEIAEVVSRRSTCSRASVGAIVAREGRILTLGYNGAPARMPHCEHETETITDGLGGFIKTVPKDSGCKIAVHAEANAIAYAARYGISLEGAELFTTLSPCLTCSQLIINAGITRVMTNNLYRDSSGLDLLTNAGIKMEWAYWL